MKSCRVTGIVFVMSLVCLVGTVQADMIVNGNFDTDFTIDNSWKIAAGSGGWFDAGTSTSPDGPSAYLNLATWLVNEPAAPLIAGQTYEVSFRACILGFAGTTTPVEETLYAHVNSTTNGVLVPFTAQLTTTWEEYSYQFTPTANEAGGGGYGVAFLDCAANASYGTDGPGWAQFGLDSVSLTAVPEPSTLAMSIVGLLGLLVCAARKRK